MCLYRLHEDTGYWSAKSQAIGQLGHLMLLHKPMKRFSERKQEASCIDCTAFCLLGFVLALLCLPLTFDSPPAFEPGDVFEPVLFE